MEMYVNNMHGNSRPLKDYVDTKEGNVTLLVFWRTCCPTNLSMIDSLININEEGDYTDKIKIVLVSVDDSRTSSRVLPIVKMMGWTDDVIIDSNMELAREMQVKLPPQWVALNHEGFPIYRRKIMEGESDSEYYYDELIAKLNNH